MEKLSSETKISEEIITYIQSHRHCMQIFEEIANNSNLSTADLLRRVVQNSALVTETTRKLAAADFITRDESREGRKKEKFVIRHNITARGKLVLEKIVASRKSLESVIQVPLDKKSILAFCSKNPDAYNFLKALRHQSLERSVLLHRYGNFGGPKEMANKLRDYGAIILRREGNQWYYDLTEPARELPFLK